MVSWRKLLIGNKVSYEMLGIRTSSVPHGNGKMTVIKTWIMGCGGGGK